MRLAGHEFPTPAAADFAMANGVEIKKDQPLKTAGPPNGAGGTALGGCAGTGSEACATDAAAGRPKLATLLRLTGLTVRQADRNVEAVLAGLARDGVVVRPFDAADCSLANLRTMCAAIAGGEVARGIAIDKHAAMGMVYGAKCPRIRPVQGVAIAPVEAGIRQFDANLLVIGYADVSQFEMQTMIRKFALAARPARTTLMESLEQLEGRNLL